MVEFVRGSVIRFPLSERERRPQRRPVLEIETSSPSSLRIAADFPASTLKHGGSAHCSNGMSAHVSVSYPTARVPNKLTTPLRPHVPALNPYEQRARITWCPSAPPPGPCTSRYTGHPASDSAAASPLLASTSLELISYPKPLARLFPTRPNQWLGGAPRHRRSAGRWD